jgi:Fe-S cluster assembly ATP-binding protein
MSELVITELCGGPIGTQILRGLTLTIRSGEVHALMGPNGSGKSTLAHLLMGRPGFEVTSGTVTLDGQDILALPTWQRAKAGLFLGLQHPTEVPGVPVNAMLRASKRAADRSEADVVAQMEIEADRIGFDRKFLSRPLNVGLSGGEKKRNETVQLAVLAPKFAILDEIDSGLDVDALRAVSRRVLQAAKEDTVGVLAITHFQRLLDELTPDVVHVFVKGRIVASGGPEIARQLEKTGYEPYIESTPVDSAAAADPFADIPF